LNILCDIDFSKVKIYGIAATVEAQQLVAPNYRLGYNLNPFSNLVEKLVGAHQED
jgi:hypothetical protein